MSQQWYVDRNGKEQGPFTAQQLKQMAASGKLQPTDKVRRDDMKSPMQAGTVKGLFASGDTTPASAAVPASPQAPTATTRPASQSGSGGSSKKKLVLGVLIGASLFVCCGGFGILSIIFVREKHAVEKELAEADTLWTAGDKALAVTKYKAVLQNKSKRGTLSNEQEAVVYGRVIDHEIEAGNTDAAKQLLAEASERKITPTVNNPDAKSLLAMAEKARPYGGASSSEPKGDVLSKDFLVPKAGTVKHYEDERYDPDTGKAVSKSTQKETYYKDGSILYEFTSTVPGQPSKSGRGNEKLEEKKGLIVWVGRLAIKPGAKPGDEWPNPIGEGTYKFLRFQKATAERGDGSTRELLRALVEFRVKSDFGGRRMEHLTEIVLEQGSGIDSEKTYMTVEGGKKSLIRFRRLTSSSSP